MMEKTNRIISVILIVCLLTSLFSGCEKNDSSFDVNKGEGVNSPEVSINIIDESIGLTEKDAELSEKVEDENISIYSMVYNAVDYDLRDKGYITLESMAFSNDATYSASGIGYRCSEFDLFDNTDYEALGFVSIIGPDDEYQAVPYECEYIAVEPIEGSFDEEASYNILAYTCESLGYHHFVYLNKYVIYYQLDSTTVRYETYDNIRENYDLSLGSLYDFDNDTYIYDADLFDDYKTHSAVELFSEEDYQKLEKELQLISIEQEKNGYYVEEINIVYISPESLQAYLDSEEEDTFFGYSVAELETSLGKGKALLYTEDGFKSAEYFERNPEEYNWKSFLTKIGIGAGIILVGAILAPITGGASFGCALITISKIAVGMALAQGLGTLAVETVSEMIKGASFEEAIKNASNEGLDAFANGFMIGAVTGSVGVVSGAIKPVACFAEGTSVAIPGMNGAVQYKEIQNIKPGDVVYSYNEKTHTQELNIVTEVFSKSVNMLIQVIIGGETITTTEEHPFYDPKRNVWVAAVDLKAGDAVLCLGGDTEEVTGVKFIESKIGLPVYNFTVEKNHTYYVGQLGVLVHNKCDAAIKQARQEGVEKAWKKEVNAVMNGNSKYNWTSEELEELLLTGKIKGYDGCHIRDVRLNPSLASDPDNIIFLKRDVHFRFVHGGNWKNPSHWGEVLKIMPQFTKQVMAIGGLL